MVISRKLWYTLYRQSDMCGRADVVQHVQCRRHAMVIAVFSMRRVLLVALARQCPFLQFAITCVSKIETDECLGCSVSTLEFLPDVTSRVHAATSSWGRSSRGCGARRLISGTNAVEYCAVTVALHIHRCTAARVLRRRASSR